jgi:DNA-binding beta-propeller fold protein YncE
MRSPVAWIWTACGIACAVVVALAATLLAGRASTEPFALGTPQTVSLGDRLHAVAPTPDGRRVLAFTQNSLAVLDAGTHAVLGSITLQYGHGGLLVAPDGKHAYVRSTDAVESIDLLTGLIEDPVIREVDGVPTALQEISPDGTRISGMIFDMTAPAVGLVDIAAGTARSVPLPPDAKRLDAVLVTPDGSRAYVVTDTVGGVTNPLQVVDLATGTTGPVPGTEGSLELALAPDGTTIHAIGYSRAVVLDTATGAVRRSVRTGGLLSGRFVVSPSGRYLYLLDLLDSRLEVFDMDVGSVVETVPVGGHPMDIELTADGSRLYVVSDAGLTIVPVTGGV